MKITVWIRPNEKGEPTERVGYKLENQDTPRIQNFGFRLIRAMTGEEFDSDLKEMRETDPEYTETYGAYSGASVDEGHICNLWEKKNEEYN